MRMPSTALCQLNYWQFHPEAPEPPPEENSLAGQWTVARRAGGWFVVDLNSAAEKQMDGVPPSGKGDRLTTFIFYIWITFVTEIIKLLNNKRGKKLQKLKNIVTRQGHVTRGITRSIDTCHNKATWHVSAAANLPMMWKSPSSWFALIAASRPRTVRPSQKQTTTLHRYLYISRYSILYIRQNL